MQSKSKTIASKRVYLVTAALIFGVAGTSLIARSFAATNLVSVEAESGTTSGTATVKNDNSASGGQFVTFVTPGTNPGTGSGCNAGGQPAPCIGSSTTGATGWGTPAFSDDFNGTTLDTNKWAPDWFGGGVMNDVTTKAANVSVTGGNLVLTLSSANEGALVSTNPVGGAKQGFAIGYGYIEARVHFPGSGASIYNWPAWWTDGQNWPTDGEIDIAEGLDTLTSNYHSKSGTNNSNTIAGIWSDTFHIYGVDRQPGKNTVYWDGKPIRTYTTDDGGSPHYFILNVGAGGQQVLGTGSQVKADYVRAWRK